jgi:two-component system, sensor histidine kinase
VTGPPRTRPEHTVNQLPDATPHLRVLVIDDSVDSAETLGALLAGMGCETVVAFDGAQGVAAAKGFHPHLAFIDLEMPGMGGCEVARRLRSHPKGSTRLICLTGRGEPDDRRTCMGAGFDDFFTKPLRPESLARVLAESAAAL